MLRNVDIDLKNGEVNKKLRYQIYKEALAFYKKSKKVDESGEVDPFHHDYGYGFLHPSPGLCLLIPAIFYNLPTFIYKISDVPKWRMYDIPNAFPELKEGIDKLNIIANYEEAQEFRIQLLTNILKKYGFIQSLCDKFAWKKK